jgi:hypothetical protein
MHPEIMEHFSIHFKLIREWVAAFVKSIPVQPRDEHGMI